MLRGPLFHGLPFRERQLRGHLIHALRLRGLVLRDELVRMRGARVERGWKQGKAEKRRRGVMGRREAH